MSKATMEWFLKCFWEELGNKKNKSYRDAYESVETSMEKIIGGRMFSSFESFKSARSRYENTKRV